MRKNKKRSATERWEIIDPIVKGLSSLYIVSKATGMSKGCFHDWVRKYKEIWNGRIRER